MNDLEELKSLLFGAEKQALDSITERVQKPETRAVDVADVLPEAVRLSHRRGPELVSTLRDPVGECVKASLHNEPEEYADALYPIMGPAIRKAIVNALRSFAQQINETIEHSLTPRGLKWRFNAWRAGVPFGEYVLQRALLYRVEQAYLISRDNGLLVGHVHHEASQIKDSDAVSAMFTAIQDFIKESFSPDRTGRLETADMGEFTLWAVHGPHALLVCVIRGVPPRSLRANLSAILERIHFRYGDVIREYSGNTTTVAGVEEELAECLRFEAQKSSEERKRGRSAPLIVGLLLVITALAYLGYDSWQARQQRLALAAAIDATPGLFVTSIERDGGVFVLQGLRDPLAATLDDVASRAGLDADQVVGVLRPYQSLDPAIIRLRAPGIVERTAEPIDAVAPEFVEEIAEPVDAVAPEIIEEIAEPVDTAVFEARLQLAELEADVARAASREFLFVNAATLADPDSVALDEHSATIRQLVARATGLGASLAVGVTGHTDSTGITSVNQLIAQQRADVAVQSLIAAGVDAALIATAIDVPDAASSAPEARRRRVSIELRLQAREGQDLPAAE